MLEYWNDGIVGFGKLEKWVIDKTHLDNDLDNEGRILINNAIPLKTNPAKDGIFDFPLFHPSIIPCVMQKHRASINRIIFSEL